MGELVSAFLSPLEFLHPVRLAITLVPYGCGAIAAREMVVRRHKGFASLMLVGLAFGLLFEGIVTRVLFDPVSTYVVPGWDSRPPAVVMFFSLLATMVVEFGVLLWLSGCGTWDDRHRLALVIGSLSFFLMFGILKDCESFTGRSLVSGAALWLLVRLQRGR
jgi:hypothetical protein